MKDQICEKVREFAELNGFEYRVTERLIPDTSIVIEYRVELFRNNTMCDARICKIQLDRGNFDILDRNLIEMNRAFIKAGK